MKTLLSLALLCFSPQLAAAETVVTRPAQPGHWMIVQEKVERSGQMERKQPEPQLQPWNRPTPLQGQTQRWNVKWEPNPVTPPARELKI